LIGVGNPTIVFWLLAILAVFAPTKLVSAQGETANSTLSGIAIVPVPVRPPLESADARFTDTAVYLIGSASATSFGLSARATIHPQLELTGKEQAVAYLYASCDDAPPAGSAGVPVATADLGTLKAGHSPQTIIATVTAISLLPMANVTCAKVAVVCKECDEPGALLAQDVTRKLPLVRESTAPLDAGDATIALIGQLDSKSFGVSFHGKVTPTEDLTGKEKLVANLYEGCNGTPPLASGTFVGAAEIGEFPAGRTGTTWTRTASASTIAPLSRIDCASLAISCPTCEPPPQPKPADYEVRKLEPLVEAGLSDVRMTDLFLALVGEPGSKSFGLAFRGTVRPQVEMIGGEKPVVRLYIGCASGERPGPKATNVATVELGNLAQGNKATKLTVTKDTTAFVPMWAIGCAVVDLD
jgi:hypothetical protein